VGIGQGHSLDRPPGIYFIGSRPLPRLRPVGPCPLSGLSQGDGRICSKGVQAPPTVDGQAYGPGLFPPRGNAKDQARAPTIGNLPPSGLGALGGQGADHMIGQGAGDLGHDEGLSRPVPCVILPICVPSLCQKRIVGGEQPVTSVHIYERQDIIHRHDNQTFFMLTGIH
jgi:hypothetical protein